MINIVFSHHASLAFFNLLLQGGWFLLMGSSI